MTIIGYLFVISAVGNAAGAFLNPRARYVHFSAGVMAAILAVVFLGGWIS